MRLSPLQRHILGVGFAARGKVGRAPLQAFYNGKTPRPKSVVKVVTATLERMIDKGWLVGLGVRTPKKWYVREVRLTPTGRRVARQLQKAQQQRLFR